MEINKKPPHIAIVPSSGMGHLIPLSVLAKRLIHDHNFTITFVIPTNAPPSTAYKLVLDKLPESIFHVFLPPVDIDDLPEDSSYMTRLALKVSRSLDSLRAELRSLSESKNLVAVVADLFTVDAFQVARELNLSPYLFFPASAMVLSLFFYFPELDKTISGEYGDLTDPILIPGCIPVHGKDLIEPMLDRTTDDYNFFLHIANMYRTAEGIMVNSFMDLEPGAIKSLQVAEPGKPPVYAIGPLVNIGSDDGNDESECLAWLDDQPRGSVLFVSFGSGGTLLLDQLTELAYGLEMSGQRFLWVVRNPSDFVANASAQSKCHPSSFLPKGFLERTKGKGLVVPNWAPQSRILNHGSTGGFLTHCGWNSTLESVVSGIPLIAWPLFAEQKMNAVMLSHDIKIAMRPEVSEDKGLIEREEIARVVKGLMRGEEGIKLRSRMKELRDAASNALGKDGLSAKALAKLANKWKNRQTGEITG